MAADTFQIPLAAAERYEERFVPRVFAQLAPATVDAGGVVAGSRVLDVGCGTGVVTRAAADRAGAAGRVVGVDLNEAMLVVARRLRPDIEWRRGDAARLPLPDASFDVVLCQSALMFFPDPGRALAEMARVVTPEGTVAIQVWTALENQPGFLPLANAVARHAGAAAVSLVATYFVHGDPDTLADLCRSAGLEVTEIRTSEGSALFDSIDEYVTTEVESTPLIERLSDEAYGRLREDVAGDLRRFCSPDGHLALPLRTYIAIARRLTAPSSAR